MALVVSFVLFFIGLAALLYGADKLVDGASHFAHRLGVSPILVGMTILSIGTSIPEIVTSITSNIMGHNAVALGNIIGSDLVQITLILGIVALLNPLKGKRKEILFFGITMIFAVLLALYTLKDGYADWTDGVVLILAYVLFLAHIIGNEHIPKHKFKKMHDKYWHHLIGIMGVGFVLILIGGNIVVRSAISIAEGFGAPEFFIAVFLVGLGTSLPELLVSGIAAWKKRYEMSIGNLLGSNVTDPTLSLGLGMLFAGNTPIAPVAGSAIAYLLFVCIIAIALFAWKKKITRSSAILLIILYGISFFVY